MLPSITYPHAFKPPPMPFPEAPMFLLKKSPCQIEASDMGDCKLGPRKKSHEDLL